MLENIKGIVDKAEAVPVRLNPVTDDVQPSQYDNIMKGLLNNDASQLIKAPNNVKPVVDSTEAIDTPPLSPQLPREDMLPEGSYTSNTGFVNGLQAHANELAMATVNSLNVPLDKYNKGFKAYVDLTIQELSQSQEHKDRLKEAAITNGVEGVNAVNKDLSRAVVQKLLETRDATRPEYTANNMMADIMDKSFEDSPVSLATFIAGNSFAPAIGKDIASAISPTYNKRNKVWNASINAYMRTPIVGKNAEGTPTIKDAPGLGYKVATQMIPNAAGRVTEFAIAGKMVGARLGALPRSSSLARLAASNPYIYRAVQSGLTMSAHDLAFGELKPLPEKLKSLESSFTMVLHFKYLAVCLVIIF